MLTSGFQIDDINEPFTFKSNTFDLVQSRMVAGGVNKGRWPSYVQDIKRCVWHYPFVVGDTPEATADGLQGLEAGRVDPNDRVLPYVPIRQRLYHRLGPGPAMESEIHAVTGVHQRSKSRASFAGSVGRSRIRRGRRGNDTSL